MGLSEREQQLLDEMERRLYQSEADVVQAPIGGTKRFNLRSVVLGILVAIVGIGVLVAGVAAQQLWLGLIGFAAMLGGAVLAMMRVDAAPNATGAPQRAAATKPSLSERMEQRWDQRLDGDR